jgi:hypothetical protein
MLILKTLGKITLYSLTFLSVSCDSVNSLKGIKFDFANGVRSVFNYSYGYKIFPFKKVPLNEPKMKITVCDRPGCDVM